jgi:hypothetical protein
MHCLDGVWNEICQDGNTFFYFVKSFLDMGLHGGAKQNQTMVCSPFLFCFNAINGGNLINMI